MTERELIYFMTIAEEKNITHAADKLHVAQPSLTQSLRRIEDELGCPLFIRRKYGLDLTPAGKLYLEMAKDVLARMNRFRDELRRRNNPLSDQVTMGASWYNTLLFLSDLVSDFSERYPYVDLHLVEKGTNDLMQLMINGELDVILAHEYPREYPHPRRSFAKDINRKRLLDEQFLLVAHRKFGIKNHLREGYADLRSLADMPFISFNANQRIRNITDYAFGIAGVTTRKVISTQSFPGAMNFAERGIGLTVLPEYYVYRNIEQRPELEWFRFSPDIHAYWSASVYYRSSGEPDEVKTSILNLLKEAVTKLRG